MRQREGVAAAAGRLSEVVVAAGGSVDRTFATVPTVSAWLTEEEAAQLQADPDVRAVRPARELQLMIDPALVRVRSDDASLADLEPRPDGQGAAVAVLDTGVDRAHPFFYAGDRTRVVSEACFSNRGDCMNGQATQVGPGAAAPLDGNPHGTHVAGIAAGSRVGAVDPTRGIAPAADVVAVQVFSRVGSGLSSTDVDILAALEWVLEETGSRDIAAVNLSLGTEQVWPASCDAGSEDFLTVIDGLRWRGALTVAAAGNGSRTDGQSWPACLSNVVGVAASDDGDAVASFTNVSAVTLLAAPGVGIRSSVPGGGYASASGTSMAAPMVSGAVALLASRFPATGAEARLHALQASPTLLDDGRLGGTRSGLPRLDVRASLSSLAPALPGAPDLELAEGDLRADLSWTAVPPAERYQLFRSTSSTCTATSSLRYEGSQRSFGDEGLVHGSTYSYCVRAIAGSEQGPLSALRTMTARDLTPPAAPRLRATTSPTEIRLTWDAVPDATGPVTYRVHRSGGTTCNSSSTVIYRGTGRSMVDADRRPATTYRYCATATDAAGNSSPLSSALRVTTSDATVPHWPSAAALGFDVVTDGVRLTWPVGFGTGPLTYEVYRDGTLLRTTTARRADVTGLRVGRTYLLEVRVRDGAAALSVPLRLSVSPTTPFRDSRQHLFNSDITWLATAGVTQGCNPPVNDRFCPSDPVTREQMAAFMVRALGLTAESGVRFRDVTRGSTFERDIDRLATAGITRGCNPPANDRFCPSDRVTREQMAAFMVRGWGLSATSSAGVFSDVSSGNTFSTDINRLATDGITRGCNPPNNTRYCPTQTVTRGQMAAFVRRASG